MTREELKEHCERQVQHFERVEKIMPVTPNDWKRYEEHKLILELLEPEPCEDVIDRAEAMTKIMMFAENVKFDEEDIYIKVSDAVQLLRELPSVNPQEPCDDVVNRQAVLNTLDNMDKALNEDRTVENYKELLKECYEVLPSVTARQKTGHWIKDYDNSALDGLYHCSVCGRKLWIPKEESVSDYPYCHCGAEMESD